MAVTINGVSVDIFGRTIRDERGALLSLRPQSFEVLRILLGNPDRLVSKQELMREVWPDIIVTDDSLVQCIHEIRAVLRDGDHSIIKTVQRRGYRIDSVSIGPTALAAPPQFTTRKLLVASIAVLISVAAGWGFAQLSLVTSERHTKGLANTVFAMLGQTVSAVSEPNSLAGKVHQEYLLGLYHLLEPSPKNLTVAKEYFEKVIRMDPANSDAHIALAKSYAQVSTLSYSRALRINFEDAGLKARQALDHLKVQNADTHTVRSWLALRRFQTKEAIAEAERALNFKSDDTDAMEALARASIFGAEPSRGLELAADMMRQNPALAHRALLLRGLAEFALEDYAQAAQDIERGMDLSSDDVIYAGVLAAAHGLLGNTGKSHQAYQRFMKAFGGQPDLARQMIVYPFADPRTAQLLAAGLEVAGAKVWFSRDNGGYLPLDMSSRLSGREIASLLKSSQIEGKGFWCGEIWQRGESDHGVVEYNGNPIHKGVLSNSIGTSTVRGNLLCEKWSTGTGDQEYCSAVFRITKANAQVRWGPYVIVTDTGPHPFKLLVGAAKAQTE